MHELSLAENMIEIVEAAAARAGVEKVSRVRLSIGVLAHVDSAALAYCCELVSRGGRAAEAAFEIERPAGRGCCRACASEFALDTLVAPCPGCGGHEIEVVGGEQMQVLEIGY